MGWRARRLGVGGAVAPTLAMVLLAAGMAPARAAPAEPAPLDNAGGAPVPDAPVIRWPIPVLHIGGVLGFDARREWFDEQKTRQHGASGTIHVRSNTYIWEPWFAQASGNLGITASQDSSGGYEVNEINNDSSNSSNSIRSLILTGGARLSVLPRSRYPFEGHYSRNHSRVETDLALGEANASERIGFTQRVLRSAGEAMLGFDRNTQSMIGGGRNRQDNLQLSMGYTRSAHRLTLAADATQNTRGQSGESALQKNLLVQHNYTPSPTLIVDNSVNLGRSAYHLQNGASETSLAQLSSMVMWRPEESKLALIAGARMFELDMEDSLQTREGGGLASRIGNANFNLGMSYEFSRSTRLNASANLNRAKSGGLSTNNANQTAGLSYAPDSLDLGEARYNWSVSGTAANRNGARTEDSARQMGIQLGHSLSRPFTVGSSTITVDGSQSLNAFVATGPVSVNDTAEQQLTNSASASWDLARSSGGAMLRLSASDTRALSGKKEFFQLINFQGSTNLATSNFSTWIGGLTMQAVRQSVAFIHFDPLFPNAPRGVQARPRWETTSSGSVSYQNQRLFGVTRLRFTSDLRLNAQALLPLLGKAQDQETAAWDNRLEYTIGRTQLRINVVLSRSSTPLGGYRLPSDPNQGESVQRTNRAVMINLSRGFGHLR